MSDTYQSFDDRFTPPDLIPPDDATTEARKAELLRLAAKPAPAAPIVNASTPLDDIVPNTAVDAAEPPPPVSMPPAAPPSFIKQTQALANNFVTPKVRVSNPPMPDQVPPTSDPGELTAHLSKDKDPGHVTGLSPQMQSRLSAMIANAPPEVGSKITINSGYRSYKEQAALYAKAVQEHGIAQAGHFVAPPGRSLHNHGQASDLGFSGDPLVQAWVHQNAAKFGLKFPLGHEPWHVEVAETRGGPRYDDRKNFSGAGAQVDASMFDPTFMALQGRRLEGGGTQSPQEQAGAASLYANKPLAYMKDYPGQIQQNVLRGASDPRLEPQVTPTVRTSNERLQPTQTIPGSVNQTPTLRVPGILSDRDKFLIDQYMNPTVASTASNYMQMMPPPPPGIGQRIVNKINELQQKHGLGPDASLFSPSDWVKAFKVLNDTYQQGKAGAARSTADWLAGLGQQFDLPDMRDTSNWNGENLYKLGQIVNEIGRQGAQADRSMTGGFKTGVEEQLGGMALGIPRLGFGIAAGLTKNKEMIDSTNYLTEKLKQLPEWAERGNLTPDMQGTAANFGRGVGQVIAPTPLKIAGNMALQAVMPWVHSKLEQLPELPDVSPISTALGDDLGAKGAIVWLPDGTHAIADTVSGPVIMKDEGIKAIAYEGLILLGIAVAPSSARYVARLTPASVKNYILPDPLRPVTATQGQVWAMSRYSDMLKGSFSSTEQPLVDVFNRWNAHWLANQNAGLNPFAGQAVADLLHIHTNSQQRSLISSALIDGELHTPNNEFRVNTPVAKIHEFAAEHTAFEEYMRLHIIQEELVANRRANREAALKPPKQGGQPPKQKPTVVGNARDENFALTDVRRDIANLERADPELKTGMNMWLENVYEGRNFASSGHYRTENPQDLLNTIRRSPATPVFSSAKDAAEVYTNIRKGESPLHVLETELDKALSERLDHEARMGYIDAHPAGTNAFKLMTKDEIKRLGISEDAVIPVRQNGESLYYVADPMVATLLKFDSQGYMHPVVSWARVFKSAFQAATTNFLAPYFAPTAAFRSWTQHFSTKPAWSSAVGPFGVTAQIVRQLGAETIRAWRPQIDQLNRWAASNGIGQVLGPNVEVATRALLSSLNNSWQKSFEHHGALEGTWLDVATERRAYINQARLASNSPAFQAMLDYMHTWTQPYNNMWSGNKSLARSITKAGYNVTAAPIVGAAKGLTTGARVVSESVGMAWARKNRNKIDPVTGQTIHPSKLAAEYRRLTGNPAERGRGIFKRTNLEGPDTFGPLPFESHSPAGERTANVIRGIGGLVEGAHAFIPWSGVLVQSPIATARAYANDPFRFMAWTVATELMPEAMAYLWNASHGPEYTSYQMDERSENSRIHYTYLAVPGKKPWEGIEIPNHQEMAPFRHGVRILADQLFGRSPRTFQDEGWDLLNTIWKSNFEPPLPSPVTAIMAVQGVVSPQGIFGDAYKPKDKGFRELNKPPNRVERILNAVVPSVADFYGQAAKAYTADEGGVYDKSMAAASAMGRRALERTSLVRDIFGYKLPASQSSWVTEELYKRKNAIRDLLDFARSEGNEGDINTKPRSKGGDALQRGPEGIPNLMFPPGDSLKNPGRPQPGSRNPIFDLAQKDLIETFQKDAPQSGGKGFLTMVKNYGQYSQALDRLANVTQSTSGTWVKEQEDNTVMNKWLEENNINRKDYREVTNFLATQRLKVAKEMLLFIMATEQRIDDMPAIRNQLGPDKHFTLEMANPYKGGLTVDTEED